MKLTRLLFTLSIAAFSCQAVSAQTELHFSPSAAVRSLGDAEEPSEEAVYGRPVSNREVSLATGYHAADMNMIAPTVASEYSYPSASSYCAPCGGLNQCGCALPNCGWFTAETLLFFAADRYAPPLVMVAGDGVNPLEGSVTFGDTLSSGVLPGFRLSAGRYLGPCGRLGIGARAYGIFGTNDRYSVASQDGTTSIGVPFFNTSLLPDPGDDAFIVSGRLPNEDPIASGGLQAGETLSMIGAEGSGYILLSRTQCHRFDLVAGYTFNQLRNSVYQSFQSTNLFDGDGIVDGTVFDYNDRFATDNRLSGAHLGCSAAWCKRVSLTTLAKVILAVCGRTTINGFGTTTVPAADPSDPPDIEEHDGFFARSGNIGTYRSERFAFLPELGIQLGYCIGPTFA